MDILSILISIAAFVFAASLIALIYLAWADSRFAQRQVIKRRLLHISAGGMHGQEKFSLYKERTLRDVGPFARIIYRLPRISSLDRLLVRANTSLNASTFILLSLSLGVIGIILGIKFLPSPAVGGLLGFLPAFIPFLLLKHSEQKSQMAFYEQIPEALDLLARAVRTGHALTSAIEIVSAEMSNPIKSEFSSVVDEVKFGINLEDALENMCSRMPLPDLRYFAISVIVHKETGGNIAEVFDNLANLIRERLQFSRQIMTLTAEGRLSATILLLLPVLMFAYLYFTNYGYISNLWTDSFGKSLMMGAIIAQIAGFLVMRKLIDVRM